MRGSVKFAAGFTIGAILSCPSAFAQTTTIYNSRGDRVGTAETTRSETYWGNGRTTDTSQTRVYLERPLTDQGKPDARTSTRSDARTQTYVDPRISPTRK